MTTLKSIISDHILENDDIAIECHKGAATMTEEVFPGFDAELTNSDDNPVYDKYWSSYNKTLTKALLSFITDLL